MTAISTATGTTAALRPTTTTAVPSYAPSLDAASLDAPSARPSGRRASTRTLAGIAAGLLAVVAASVAIGGVVHARSTDTTATQLTGASAVVDDAHPQHVTLAEAAAVRAQAAQATQPAAAAQHATLGDVQRLARPTA
jgi:hypothetical protein